MTENIPPNAVIAASETLLHATIQDEVIVLDSDSRMYYSLNSVGGSIWELLQQPRTIEEIYDAVAKEYDIEPNHCESDVNEFIGELIDEGLVEIQEGGHR